MTRCGLDCDQRKALSTFREFRDLKFKPFAYLAHGGIRLSVMNTFLTIGMLLKMEKGVSTLGFVDSYIRRL